MSDYAIAVVHEPLVRLVEAEAPGVRLSIGHLGPGVRESPTALIEHDALVAPLGIGFPGSASSDAARSHASIGPSAIGVMSEGERAAERYGHGDEVMVDRVAQVIPGELDRQFDAERSGTDTAAAFGEITVAGASVGADSSTAAADEGRLPSPHPRE